MEAESMAASKGTKDLAWMEKIAVDLGHKLNRPPPLYVDNQPAIELSKTTKFHSKAKHIRIRYFFVRNDMVQENRIRIEHKAGTEQIADLLTKAILKYKFEKLIVGFGIKDQLSLNFWS
ncbi:hypothetical protein K3495_g821 [Podosphaera aphanis]|nr:hypothetical protein K3495_g821 [Podosphaera aphanis]